MKIKLGSSDRENQRELFRRGFDEDPGHAEVVREVLETILAARWYHWLIFALASLLICLAIIGGGRARERELHRQFDTVSVRASA